MYHVTLTEEQRRELNHRAHQAYVAPCLRDRLEMLRLSDAGWSVPRIAQHLSQHQQTVRRWIKAFLSGGFDALTDKPHGGKQSALTPVMLQAIRAEIARGERTWNAGQVAPWLHEKYGVCLSTDRMRVHLKRAGLVYKRTSRSLKHKQNAQQVAAKQATLTTLEKGARPN